MEGISSFDRLVIGMSQAERMEMYNKLSASFRPEDQIVAETAFSKDFDTEIDVQEKLKNESIFVRFFLYLRSLFSGIEIAQLYTGAMLQKQARSLERKYPLLISSKKRTLKFGFYDAIKNLKSVAEYFLPSINLYEEEPGRFYVFLSSILIPEIYLRIQQDSDPFLIEGTKEPSPELRMQLLRKMEDGFQEITGQARNSLYVAVSSIDWLRQFVRLPFEKMLSRFSVISAEEAVCQLDVATTELNQFARVLCNSHSVQTEVLQALFLFSVQSQLKNPNVNIDELTTQFISKSVAEIGTIRRFLVNVPLRPIALIANNKLGWSPNQPDGVENWFVKYKNEWRKMFDTQWSDWCNAQKKKEIEKKICVILESDEEPLLPYRPWLEIWTPLKFKMSLAMGFLWAFFKKAYPIMNKDLKILLRDGDFKLRDNGNEFADSFKEMNKISTDMLIYADKFSQTGEFGRVFADALEKDDRTIHTYSRFDTVMTSALSDASILATRFCNASIRLTNVLTGVVSETKVGNYDTLNNIAAIQGRENQAYRLRLERIRNNIADASECFKELQTVEK